MKRSNNFRGHTVRIPFTFKSTSDLFLSAIVSSSMEERLILPFCLSNWKYFRVSLNRKTVEVSNVRKIKSANGIKNGQLLWSFCEVLICKTRWTIESERLCLENALQWGEVDDQQLANK
jgi:hypothetical protein